MLFVYDDMFFAFCNNMVNCHNVYTTIPATYLMPKKRFADRVVKTINTFKLIEDLCNSLKLNLSQDI